MTKPEPSGVVTDSASLRERDNKRQVRFLNARRVAVCMCEQHRVQGVTLTGEVHVLLNKEFFAEGASHCRTLHVQHMKRPLHN